MIYAENFKEILSYSKNLQNVLILFMNQSNSQQKSQKEVAFLDIEKVQKFTTYYSMNSLMAIST